MDGLSAAASVVAVIQIAQAVGSALKDYYQGVRDSREDIQKLYNSVCYAHICINSGHEKLQVANKIDRAVFALTGIILIWNNKFRPCTMNQ